MYLDLNFSKYFPVGSNIGSDDGLVWSKSMLTKMDDVI